MYILLFDYVYSGCNEHYKATNFSNLKVCQEVVVEGWHNKTQDFPTGDQSLCPV